MKIITANGKKRIVMTREEWRAIGKKAGWDEDVATQPVPFGINEETRNKADLSEWDMANRRRKGREFIGKLWDETPEEYDSGADMEQAGKHIKDIIDKLRHEFKDDPVHSSISINLRRIRNELFRVETFAYSDDSDDSSDDTELAFSSMREDVMNYLFGLMAKDPDLDKAVRKSKQFGLLRSRKSIAS